MTTTRVDPSTPIIPDYGLGGLVLRKRAKDIQDLIREVRVCQEIGPFELRYACGSVSICVDRRNGRVFKLIAHVGYSGKLFDQIAVGMVVRDAMRLEPRLYDDEFEESLYVRGVAGVCMDVGEHVRQEMVLESAIETIAVFDRVILTRQGQDGEY